MATAQNPVADPALRQALEAFVRRRVAAAEVDDIVQTVLCEALSPRAPKAPGELKRWALAVARNKVADFHRKSGREELDEVDDHPAASAMPLEERSLAAWAEKSAGDGTGQETLRWMAREGEGEKLEAIAASEKVPAARVRQRVSRLRRMLREQWRAELAAVAIVGALLLYFVLREDEAAVAPIADQPELTDPTEQERDGVTIDDDLRRAAELRRDAAEACDDAAWSECLKHLDDASDLDPAGDTEPAIEALRDRAERGLDGAETDVEEDAKVAPNEDGDQKKQDFVPAPAPTGKPGPNQPKPPPLQAPPPQAPAPPPSQPPVQPEQQQQQAPTKSLMKGPPAPSSTAEVFANQFPLPPLDEPPFPSDQKEPPPQQQSKPKPPSKKAAPVQKQAASKK